MNTMAMNQLRRYLLLIGGIAFLFSCEQEESFVPSESFIKIYNDEHFNSSYIPIDVVQAGENGYLTLSAFESWNT